jgi:transcriptional regulator with XRE-family HTH domain
MFPDRLRAAMKAKGLGVYGLARALKVSPNAIYKWIQGRRVPQFRIAVALARVLDVSVEWLAGGE